MRLRDEDTTIILMEIAEVEDEIGEVKEALHKLGRKFGVCPFLIIEVAPVNPISNVTLPDNIPAIPKGVA